MTIAPNENSGTLSSNTGLDSQTGFTVALDWLDVTFRKLDGANHARQVVKDFETLTGDSIDFSPTLATFNGRLWDGSGGGVLGTRVWYKGKHDDDDGKPVAAQLKISMSGSVLAGTDESLLAIYFGDVASHLQPECTRIDIALDDRQKYISLGKIADARRKGNFFNTSYSAEMTSGYRGKIQGRTFYFGAPSSEKRLRIYDKTVESQGKIDANRWEAQFRKKSAQAVFEAWTDTNRINPTGVARLFQNYVLGLVDFRNRPADEPNRYRCNLLAWYSDLCKVLGAEPARVRARQVIQSVQKSIEWIAKSVAPSLAVIKAVIGENYERYINEVVLDGVTRLSSVRRKLIEKTDKEQLCY